MKNDFFNINRFSLLIKRDLLDTWPKILLNTALFIVSFSAMFYALSFTSIFGNYSPKDINKVIIAIYIGILTFALMVSASNIMRPMSSKEERLNYLKLPASQFEKFLSRWLYCTLFIAVAIWACAWISDGIRILALSFFHPHLETAMAINSNALGLTAANKMHFFIKVIFFHSIFVLGSTFWQKRSFVKTFLVLIAISMVISYVKRVFGYSLFDMNIPIKISNDNIDDILTDRVTNTLNYILMAAASLFFWALSYYRFTRMGIVKRGFI